ncbi:ion channel [Bacteroidota bacterium]
MRRHENLPLNIFLFLRYYIIDTIIMSKSQARQTRFSKLWNPIMLALVFFITFVVSLFPASWHEILYSVSITLLFITAVLTMSKRRGLILILVGIAVGMEWLSSILSLAIPDAISKVLNFCFFAFMVGYYINLIAIAEKVTPKVIFQAIIGYLLLGLVYSILIGLVIEINPAMFNIPVLQDAGNPAHFSEYLYFGFVTFTTLGYGDIFPVLPFARSLSILISVSGQLYLAIIIALLVGKYSSQRK